jgi:DNA ligase (NAD+)
MLNVPLAIPCSEPLEVRGEGVISWENFDKLNATAEETYAHPRNVAAGGIRRLDASKTRTQLLEFMAFDIVSDEYATKTEQLTLLQQCGFSVMPFYVACESAVFIPEVIKSFEPKKFQYPVDGLIIEYDDLVYGRSLGATGHHEKRLIGLKWEDELHGTVFIGLELATTRNGMISITAMFEDTVIDGTTVNRAYLHNLDIVERFELGMGDHIQVYKANQIIPQVAANLTRSNTLKLPTECPCCESSLTIQTSDGGTRSLYCENPSCPAKLIRKFVHYCHKTRMNIPDLSEKRLESFIDNGWVKNLGDLYDLERHRYEFIATAGFGMKLFTRLQSSIHKSRSCTLAKFIAALGIPMVGRSAGRTIHDYFGGDWVAFEQAIHSGFDFTQLKDFGQTMHENIYTWHNDAEEAKFWRPVMNELSFIKSEKENEHMNENNPFHGKTVVATGKLLNYTRDGIQEKLYALGAKPASSVTSGTDYLIVGEKAGSKLSKAQELGVKTLTEEEFENMLETAE